MSPAAGVTAGFYMPEGGSRNSSRILCKSSVNSQLISTKAKCIPNKWAPL